MIGEVYKFIGYPKEERGRKHKDDLFWWTLCSPHPLTFSLPPLLVFFTDITWKTEDEAERLVEDRIECYLKRVSTFKFGSEEAGRKINLLYSDCWNDNISFHEANTFLKEGDIKFNHKIIMDNKTKIKNILEGIYNDLELRKKVVPLFLGNPGINKTSAIREFAKEKGVRLVPLVLSQRSPNEISGALMPENGQMRYFDYDLLKSLKKGDILLLDEVLNTKSMVLDACLTILMERELISGHKLPNIMIVAAANPQGATRLTPQQKERFLVYDIELDEKGFQLYLEDKYDMPESIARDVVALVKSETFVGNKFNYKSARSIDTAIEMMIKEIPTPYEEVLSSILNRTIKNEEEGDILLKDGSLFLKGELMSYLKIMRKIR